jgi:lipoprotein-anchoring transpeptidase ErfK/SrfK
MTFRLSAGLAVSVALLFVTPTPGAAEPNKALYELQERCAKEAREVFQKKWGDGIVKDKTGEIAANYENHYNARLNKWDKGKSEIMIMDRGIADAGAMGEGALPGLRSRLLNRRAFLFGSAAGLAALGLAGCASDYISLAEAEKVYGPVPNEKFPIPAVDVSKVNPKYFRKTVRYDSNEAPGTIIIDPSKYYVYRIEGEGNATRYGANVGRDGFRWSGEAYVGRKAEWPTWTPPKEMIARQPEAGKYARGMPGGLDNPLGARVLYLYQNGVYTLYTIYSTSDPETIGNGITSGCTGLLSQDMIDLYSRTPVKTKVIVLPA